MMNLIKLLLVISVTIFRFYAIFNIIYILYNSYSSKSLIPNDIWWFISVIILDIYFLQLENSISVNIYNKGKNE